MKNIFLFFTLFTLNFSFAQVISFEKINKNITDSKSEFFYDNLVEVFKNQPSLLRTDSLKTEHLYYGKLYSRYYKKASEIKSQNLKFIKLTGKKKYSKAILLGEELLDKDPVNLVLIMNLINCYKNSEESNKEERLKKLGVQAEILLSAIARYGDGKSKETSFKVIALGDEFILLNYLGIDLHRYTRTSEKNNPKAILDLWTKDKNFKEDHRDMIYITVYSNQNVSG